MQARHFQWRGRHGEQFSGKGVGFYTDDPNSSHREVDWSRKDVVVLSSAGGAGRLVNNEAILAARALTPEVTCDIFGPYLRKAAKSNPYDAEAEVEDSRASMPKTLFRRIPVHPYILTFQLELPLHVWVHVADMALYVYRPELKQKLVLPGEQTDLIDIFTAEMDVLMVDIVAGKSGGATVLCAGPLGVGKTLPADACAEIIRRPLYRMHSGQLGLGVAAMENALKVALMRAQRWGAVMLIEEADVYIKRRDDDMTMKAVVGVFLRVLEYFSRLPFLTTHRIDDIDEADRRAGGHPPAATGRNINGLARLVAKYCCHRGLPPTLEVFERRAIFRGIVSAQPFGNRARVDGSQCRKGDTGRKSNRNRRKTNNHKYHNMLPRGARIA